MKIANRVSAVITSARLQRMGRARARAVTSKNYTEKPGSGNHLNVGNSSDKDLSNILGTGSSFKNVQKKRDLNAIIDSAENLQKCADKIKGLKVPEETADAAAKAKYKTELMDQVKQFADQYNSLSNRLGKSGSALDSSLAKQMKNYMQTNQKSLNEIGITINDSGALKVDDKVLNEADINKLTKLFTEKGGFAEYITDLAESARSRAQINLSDIERKEFLSSFNYNNRGNAYNNYGSNSGYNWRS